MLISQPPIRAICPPYSRRYNGPHRSVRDGKGWASAVEPRLRAVASRRGPSGRNETRQGQHWGSWPAWWRWRLWPGPGRERRQMGGQGARLGPRGRHEPVRRLRPRPARARLPRDPRSLLPAHQDRALRGPDDQGSARLGIGLGEVQEARKACGKRLRRRRGYRFKRSGSDVILRRARSRQDRQLRPHRRRPAAAGRSGSAARALYRGKLKAKASGGDLLVINAVGLEGYAKGVVPNEMPSSWPQAALRAQAVAARSYALATSGGGAFDVYDDTRSQVYGGKDSETERTNKAVRRTERSRWSATASGWRRPSSSRPRVVGRRASSTAFPGADPVRYLKSVPDPYDGASPVPQMDGRGTRRTRSSRGSPGCFPAGCERSRS